MPRRIHLAPHLTADELSSRYRRASDPVERSHWASSALPLAASWRHDGNRRGRRDRLFGLLDWPHRSALQHTEGPDGVRDRRHTTCAGQPDLPVAQLTELGAALAGPHPEGDHWCGRRVAAWISTQLGCRVCRQTGWRTLRRLGARWRLRRLGARWRLRRLGARWRLRRPRHVHADPVAQAEFVARLRPLLRQVATAFPRARVAV
jgi:hypothetical protein